MDAFDCLQASPYFGTISHTKLAAAAKCSPMRYYKGGDIVSRAGLGQTHLYYVHSGALEISRHNPTQDITLLLGRITGPSLYGDMEAMSDAPWAVTARAEGDVTAVALLKNVFVQLIAGESVVLAHLYRDACVRHLLANHSTQAAALYDVETRLLRLLLDYAKHEGHTEGDCAVISRPLAQIDLAHMLGVHRRTIARTIEPLIEQGLLARSPDGKSFALPCVSAVHRQIPPDLFGLSSQFGNAPKPIVQG